MVGDLVDDVVGVVVEDFVKDFVKDFVNDFVNFVGDVGLCVDMFEVEVVLRGAFGVWCMGR